MCDLVVFRPRHRVNETGGSRCKSSDVASAAERNLWRSCASARSARCGSALRAASYLALQTARHAVPVAITRWSGHRGQRSRPDVVCEPTGPAFAGAGTLDLAVAVANLLVSEDSGQTDISRSPQQETCGLLSLHGTPGRGHGSTRPISDLGLAGGLGALWPAASHDPAARPTKPEDPCVIQLAVLARERRYCWVGSPLAVGQNHSVVSSKPAMVVGPLSGQLREMGQVEEGEVLCR